MVWGLTPRWRRWPSTWTFLPSSSVEAEGEGDERGFPEPGEDAERIRDWAEPLPPGRPFPL